MTHEYGDPLNLEALRAAAARVVAQRRSARDQPLNKLVEQAVREHICSCAVDIEDHIEGSRSGLHDATAHEVRRLAECELKAEEEPSMTHDEIDRAADQSIPPAIRPLGSTED